MRVKRAKGPSRSIQYRLLADRKLQRLSLRKVTERLKRAKKASRSIRSKKAVRGKAATTFAWATSSRTIVLAMICVVVAAALVTARQDAPRAEVAHTGTPPPAVAPSRDSSAQRQAKKPVIARDSAPVPLKAAVESTPQAELHDAGAVTMTGCLELDERTFRLTDVSGVDAPRSRSWRSGFLRKRPATVELVDATNNLRLPTHVGRRITATGTLIDGEMRARSLRLVATSCRS